MLNVLKKALAKIIFGDLYKGNLKVGDIVYYQPFKMEVVITKITSDKWWYFCPKFETYSVPDAEYKSKLRLSQVEKEDLLEI